MKTGFKVTITPRDVAGTATLISTTFPGLAREVGPGARILLSDGLIELRVLRARGNEVECEVVNGGMLAEHQGINLPGVALSIPALTAKDRADLEFGLNSGVDMVALSFVRSGADVGTVKKIVAARGRDVPVIAKLEKPQALKKLEEIFEASDGVMVARGDLGVEMPAEKSAGDSEVCHPPGRGLAQAGDHRHPDAGIHDRKSASHAGRSQRRGERGLRRHRRRDVVGRDRHRPLPARNRGHDGQDRGRGGEQYGGVHPAAPPPAAAPVDRGSHLRIHRPCRRGSPHGRDRGIHRNRKHRDSDLQVPPQAEIYAFCRALPVCNRLNLLWGVQPVLRQQALTAEEMLYAAEQELVRRGRVKTGDVLGVVAGTQMASGSTNFMRLHLVTAEEERGISRRRARGKKSRRVASTLSPVKRS